jgi:hypothetical protein
LSAITEADGKPDSAIVLGTGNKEEKFESTKHTIDRARGFLISRIQRFDQKTGKQKAETLLLQTGDCGDGRLFPTRWVYVDFNPTTKGTFFTREMKVQHFDATNRPKTSDFTFTAPAGTKIIFVDDPTYRSFFRFRQSETIAPDDLARLKEMCEKAKTNRQMDTAIKPEKQSTVWWWLVGVVGLLVVIVVGRRFLAGKQASVKSTVG